MAGALALPVRSKAVGYQGFAASQLCRRPKQANGPPAQPRPSHLYCRHVPTLHALLDRVCHRLSIASSQVCGVHSAAGALQHRRVATCQMAARRSQATATDVLRSKATVQARPRAPPRRVNHRTWLRALATATGSAPYLVTASTEACASCWVRFSAGASVAALETASVLPALVAFAIIWAALSMLPEARAAAGCRIEKRRTNRC